MSGSEWRTWTVPKSGLLLIIEEPEGCGFERIGALLEPEQLFDWRALAEAEGPIVSPRLVGRLRAGELCVLAGPLWKGELRTALRRLGGRYFRPVSALHLRPSKGERGDRASGSRRARLEVQNLGPVLEQEGYYRMQSMGAASLEKLQLLLEPLPVDRRELTGPFDLIGDLHGCIDELEELLEALGYRDGVHRQGRTLVFVGDLGDRGPASLRCLRKVRALVEAGRALCVLGNHDDKLLRYLQGRSVKVDRGLETTVAELAETTGCERASLRGFLEELPEHLLLDGGALVVAHAGLPEAMHGGVGRRVKAHCLYGKTSGRLDSDGLPERLDWAADYRAAARVVYGHTPVRRAVWRCGTINIDTGCVFGGSLTGLRYPEGDSVSIPARRVYAGAARAW